MGAMAVAEHLPKWATVVGYDQIAVRGLDAPERVVRLGFAELVARARRTRSAASPHPRGGRQLRRRRPGPAAAVLLAELRRHVAAAAGTAPESQGAPGSRSWDCEPREACGARQVSGPRRRVNWHPRRG